MILNIAPDDKFVPFLQGLFEEASPGESLWRVYTDNRNTTFALQSEGMEVIHGEYFGSEKFKDDLQVSNCVIIHSLFLSSLQKLLVLSRIPENTPIVWRGWGSDYYSILQASGLRLVLPETNSLLERPGTLKRVLGKPFPRKFLEMCFSKAVGQIINRKLIARINVFSCCVPDDFKALQHALPEFRARFLPLNYYSAEDIFLRGDNLQNLTGHDILLGNSATAANNHIEAMRVLSRVGMHDRRIVVPLSYGDMKYKKKIIRAGEELLGESFVPLTNYLPLPKYNQALSGCRNLIMNHIRQQAMGNISSALLRGGKVFLRAENPIYKYYIRMGVKIFPFSDDITIADIDAPLDKDDALTNKDILMNIWSRAEGIRNVRAILSLGK